MSKIEYWDATLGPKPGEVQTRPHDKTNCDIWASMGGNYPYHLYFPKPAWQNTEYFVVRTHRALREVDFKPEFKEWLKDHCKGKFIDWVTLNAIQFELKADALMVKLVWG